MTDTEAASAHPCPERLRPAFAQGRLGGPEMDEIEHHLFSCDDCGRTVREAPGDSFLTAVRTAGRAAVAGFEIPSSFTLGPEIVPTVADRVLPEGLADHPRYRVVGVLGSGGMGAGLPGRAPADGPARWP